MILSDPCVDVSGLYRWDVVPRENWPKLLDLAERLCFLAPRHTFSFAPPSEVSPSGHVDWVSTLTCLTADQSVFYQVGIDVCRLSFCLILKLSISLKHTSIERLSVFCLDKGIVVQVVESLESKSLPHRRNISLLHIWSDSHVTRQLIHIVAHGLKLAHRRQSEVFRTSQVYWMAIVTNWFFKWAHRRSNDRVISPLETLHVSHTLAPLLPWAQRLWKVSVVIFEGTGVKIVSGTCLWRRCLLLHVDRDLWHKSMRLFHFVQFFLSQ